MKRLLFAALISFSCIIAGAKPVSADEHGYFSAFPELPVPPLMQEDADEAVRFDQPEGRIITLQARGTATLTQIIAFYDATLPSLGWTRNSVAINDKAENDEKSAEAQEKRYYTRGDELLFLEISSLNDKEQRLNILLRPR